MTHVRTITDPPSWDGSEGVLAYVLCGRGAPAGACFVTAPEEPLQLGTVRHATGHVIGPHHHPACCRPQECAPPREVLVVTWGRVEVMFFNSRREHVDNATLWPGDAVMFVAGGHGLAFLDDAELVEVRQGPYRGEGDKERWSPTSS